MRSDTPRLRLAIIGIVAVSLFGALFARLWYLQILASPEYRVQATANQQRIIVEPAPRGRILDRNGVVLVDNRLSFVAALDRQVLASLDDDERADLLGRLVEELVVVEPTLTVEVLEDRLGSDRYSPYTPVPVAEDIPEDLAVYLTEHGADFADAVHIDARAIRNYPYGRLASHVLGYVGPINDEEFAARQDSDLAYQLTDEIGKSGVERTFEADLRGTAGIRVLEVDRQGRTVQELDYTPPVAGNDVYLSIDVQVQAVAEQALEEELANARERRVRSGNPPNVAQAGSVVVEDPRDGSIVAMASYPDFDPSTFTDGIDPVEWAALTSEGSFYPFVNRAIEGQYAPGSTFKLVSAIAGLRSGTITTGYEFHDPGYYLIPNCSGRCRVNNAGSEPHGNVNLAEAMTVSSDAYFYRIGAEVWFQREGLGDPIQDAAHDFGFGADTGVSLPNEKSGRIMTPEEFAQRHLDNPDVFVDGDWQAGDNINMAIGQGEVLATPLQLANAYAALANGGQLFTPNIVLRVQEPGADEVVRSYEPRVRETFEIQPDWVASLSAGFTGVPLPGGTASGAFQDFPEGWVVAGKTGTAQVGTPANPRADTAIFVGMGPMIPGQAPQYVASAFLEESGFGGSAAAPVVARIFAPLADPSLMPELLPGGLLGAPLAEAGDPLGGGNVLD